MQEVLLRFVGRKQHRSLLAERVPTSRLRAKEPSKCVNLGSGETPFFVIRPRELLLHGRGHAPAVCETKLGEHRASRDQAEVLDEILPQQAHGHGVEQKRSLASKPNRAALRVQLQELVVVQIFNAHWVNSVEFRAPTSFRTRAQGFPP